MEADPPLDEFLSGGYLLARIHAPAPENAASFYLPGQEQTPILSASPCISDILPDGEEMWPLDQEMIQGYENEHGIRPERVEAFLSWRMRRIEEGRSRHGDAFADLDIARDCVRRFVASRVGLHLLGLGLHKDLLAGYREAVGPCERMPPNGVHELVQESRPMAGGACPLGYEVLDVHPLETRHSWLCHGLVREMHEELGVQPGRFGLIPRHNDACRVAALIEDDRSRCEPGVWRSWRIVEYGLEG